MPLTGQRLDGAKLLYEHEAEETPLWTDADDDDLPCDRELSRSYHLFFLAPKDDAFAFEANIESEAEPESDECCGAQEAGSKTRTTALQGRGHTGWSVAVSLVAPFAAIALSGNPVNAEDDFREVHGQRLFQRLEKLRTRIVGILEKHGVMVLPEMEWRQVVPWLRSDGSAFVGDAVNQPIRVLDVFFFEGV